MKKVNPYGSAPVFVLRDDLKAEWEGLDENIKKSLMNHLTRYTKEMTLQASIDTLCCVVQELIERVKMLEEKE